MKTAIPIILLLACSPSAFAQDPPPTPYGPLFSTLFPIPSGINGFEEIVQAGDLARMSDILNTAIDRTSTLTEKRRALADPDLKRALSLLRAGLAKGKVFPRTSGEGPPLDVFSPLRSLGRLLMVEQYVLLADGKVGAATDSLRDGLNLGHSVAGEMLIGSLVTSAIDAIVIRVIAQHLDQFSVKDCDRLMNLANDWLSMPDPGIAALDAEREFSLRQVRTDLSANPGLAAEVSTLLSARISTVQNMLRQEPWKRTSIPPIEGSTLGAVYVRNLGLDDTYQQVLEAFTRDLARVQMLGVHAAIRRFRWEYNRLPSTLDELKLGRLGRDPFTGAQFLYQKSGESAYTLKSVKVDRL